MIPQTEEDTRTQWPRTTVTPPNPMSPTLCVRLFAWLSPRRTRDASANRRGVGSPRKHLPRKRLPADLRSLARGHTELCIRVLAGIVSQEAVPAAARVSAAGILLDRGWGRVPQTQAGTDGEGEIEVVIRHIVVGRDSALDAKLIDATPVRREGGDKD